MIRYYTTKQVAEFLHIELWRIKNYSQGAAYGLPPSQQLGSGRGSRKLYAIEDVLKIAIAHELNDCGFTPQFIGNAIRIIPEAELHKNTGLLLVFSQRWLLYGVRDKLPPLSHKGVFFLGFQALLMPIIKAVNEAHN